MTVAVETPVVSYTGDGVTTSFPLTFSYTNVVDVTADVSLVGVPVAITYSVSGTNVVFTSPPALGTRVTLGRATARAQLTAFPAGNPVPSDSLAIALDRQMRIEQELDLMIAGLAAQALAGTGVSAAVIQALTATEAIAAGAFVNLYAVGTAIRVRNANASNPATFASGFSATAIPSGGAGPVATLGANAVSLVTAASEVWLSDAIPGAFTLTPPSTPGSIVQSLGAAIPGVGIFFIPQPRILL